MHDRPSLSDDDGPTSDVARGMPDSGADAQPSRFDGPPPAPSTHAKDRTVALLLSAAAVFAAILATWAALTSSSASGSWQSALRTEVKRAAGTVEDVRYTFTAEGPIAYSITEALVREAEFRTEAARRTGDQQAALLREATIQATVAELLMGASDVAADPRYALPDGGYDLIARLADTRAAYPELLALDPEADQLAGDQAAEKTRLIVAVGIPVGLTIMFGALAKAFGRYRRPLLAAGSGALGLAVVCALAIAGLP